MLALATSLFALALGPALYQLLVNRYQLGRMVLLVLGLVVAILVVFIITHTVEDGGWIALVFALVGFLLPLAAERALHSGDLNIHRATMVLGIIGLVVHSISDGVALTTGHFDHASHGVALQSAVLLHRLPMGLAIWWLASDQFGNRVALASLLVMGLATIVGYFGGDALMGHAGETGRAWFIAFAAGSLLHLATHRLGGHGHHHH